MLASLGQGFPDGSANSEHPQHLLPAQLAYFDGVEQQRFASTQTRRLAPSSEAITPSSTESSAQAGSAELAMADTSSIR